MGGRTPLSIRCSIFAGLLALLATQVSANEGAAQNGDLCIAAAQRAASSSTVPFSVLLAITQTETGRSVGGSIQPWPWTLNVAGQGYWHLNRDAALKQAMSLASNNTLNFDVGCFQINYRWHGQHFASLALMLDPDAGAEYAARFLEKLYLETGSWSEAAGAYHSRTPHYAARYRQRFDEFHTAALAAGGRRVPTSPRENSFPLLRASNGRANMGSLVPLFDGG